MNAAGRRVAVRVSGAVLVSGALLGLVACDRGSGQPPAPAVEPAAAPRAVAFRVVYRVDDSAGPDRLVSTDVLQVAQPWNSRLEHRDGPPPGGPAVAVTVQNERFTLDLVDGSAGFATRRVPGPLAAVPSPEVLEAAAAAGLVDRLGESTVAGAPCTRWAYRATNRVLGRPSPEEAVETCVTPDGVPLREATTLGGTLVRVAEAVQVDRRPPVSAETFHTAGDPGTGDNLPLVDGDQTVTEEPPDGAGIVTVRVPAGFRASRRVGVVRPAGPGPAPVRLFVQAFEQGVDLVTTEEVTTPDGAPWPADEGQPIDAGDGRDGRIVYRAAWAEVRVAVGGRAVRVSSPRPALALAVARALRA